MTLVCHLSFQYLHDMLCFICIITHAYSFPDTARHSVDTNASRDFHHPPSCFCNRFSTRLRLLWVCIKTVPAIERRTAPGNAIDSLNSER